MNMFPARLCLCVFLLATCSARPNWHKGVVIVDDSADTELQVPQPFVTPTYHEALAAQAIKNAGENAQLQMAMMKKRYMDFVRQNFFNAFVPHSFSNQKPFDPNLHSEYPPMNGILRQPLLIHHTPQNPCSGSILKCLDPNNKLGKIVPLKSQEIQPCFGPNCKPIILEPHTMVIPKPSHSSHSKKPLKRPHHRLCHRKQPHQNCHHQSTFWPTYATVKVNTKLSPSASIYPTQEIKNKSSVQARPTQSDNQFSDNVRQDFILPSESLDKTTNSILDHENTYKNFETLKTNVSGLEHEILGTNKENISFNRGHTNIEPITISQSPDAKHSLSTSEFLSESTTTKFNPTTFESITGSIKDNSKSIPPLKTLVNMVDGAPAVTFHTNDVIVRPDILISTEIPFDLSKENKNLITPFTGDTKSELTSVSTAEENSELRSSIEVTTLGPISEYYTSLTTEKKISSSTSTSLEAHEGLPEYKNGEQKPETLPSSSGITKLEWTTTSIIGEFIPSLESSTTNSNVIVASFNKEQTTAETDEETSRGSILLDKNGEDELSYRTTDENSSQMFDHDLRGTTPKEALYRYTTEKIFENTFEQPVMQTTLGTVPDTSVSTELHHQHLGREDIKEDTTNAGSKTTVEDGFDSSRNTNDKIAPEVMVNSTSYTGVLEETTLQLEPKFLLEHFPDNRGNGMDSISNKDSVESVPDNSLGGHIFTTTYSSIDELHYFITHNKQESRVENSSESVFINHFSTVNLYDVETTTKSLKEIEPCTTLRSNSIVITPVDLPNNSEIQPTISLVNIETTVQNNEISEAPLTTNQYSDKEATNQMSSIDLKDKYNQEENFDKQSKTDSENENYSFESTVETTKSFITDKNHFTEGFLEATETIIHNDIITSPESREILVLTEENENFNTFVSLPFGEHTTTDGKTSKTLQTHEYNEEEPHEIPILPETTSELSPVKDITDTYEANIASVSVTEKNIEGNTNDISVFEITEFPELRENTQRTTTVVDYIETKANLGHIESSSATATTTGTTFESTQIITENVFGKTDSPGPIISEDWTEEPIVSSLNVLTDNVLIKYEPTNYPQLKVNEEEYTLEEDTPSSTEKTRNELLLIHKGNQEQYENIPPDTTSEISSNKGSEFQELNTTPNLVTESDHVKNTNKDPYVNTLNETPKFSNNDEATTMTGYTGTTLLNSDIIQSNLNLPEITFGNTDTPGLLIKENWIDFATDVPSTTNLIDFTDLVKNHPTSYPLYKSEEEEFVSKQDIPFSVTETNAVDNSEGTQSIVVEFVSSTQTVNAPTISNGQTITEESRNNFLSNEATSAIKETNDSSSFQSYQSGVLKFTSEIETTTEKVMNAKKTEGETNNGLSLELKENLSLNRRMRSAQGLTEEIINPTTYPTTECVFCMLGLPHGHKIKRAIEDTSQVTLKDGKNIKDESKVVQGEKSNNSSGNLEYLDSSKLYASTILELLPVIREGYKNDAFSEEDKKVIRSLFGDMKSLIDEDTLDRITESTSDLLMGDGASRIDDSVEVIDYDSSEGMLEDEVRLKRSKKWQIMNNLLKKFPNNSEKHFEVPTQLKHSRKVRSSPMSQAEAGAILALLTGKETVQIGGSDEEDDEYEYYEDVEDEDDYEEDSSYSDAYEDDYDEPSIGELIKLARRHRERKAKAGKT